MKNEVLKFVPVGTPLDSAIQIMHKNDLKGEMDLHDEFFMYGGKLDFLLFFHDEGVIFSMNRWKVALVYKDAKVADVQVQFVIISL